MLAQVDAECVEGARSDESVTSSLDASLLDIAKLVEKARGDSIDSDCFDTRSGVVDTVSALALFLFTFSGSADGLGIGSRYGGSEVVGGGGRNRFDVTLGRGRGRGIAEGVLLPDIFHGCSGLDKTKANLVFVSLLE